MTIGQDITPGIVSDIESTTTVSVSGLSEANAAIVGQGDLGEGTAEPNSPYTITRASQVRDLFGEETMITRAIEDAFEEGAMPVYAVVTDEEAVTDTLGTSSTSGTLEQTPVSEDPEDTVFDGRETYIIYDDPANYSVEVGEAYLNPVTGEYEVGEVPTDGEEVSYTTYDYDGALDALQDEEADVLDYVAVLNENSDVTASLQSTLADMESYHQFAVGICGASPVLDMDTYEAPFNDSRMQVFYPSRNSSDDSILGSVAGMKARLGIDGSVMNRRLTSQSRLKRRIDFDDETVLIGENTVPVRSETAGARIVDDPTCVAEDNEEESSMDQGYTRFVVDRVTTIVKETEDKYIGSLHTQMSRSSLEASISSQLQFLSDQNAILEYDVNVQEKDAMSAYVDVSIETVSPLRNIYNTISAGRDE